MGASFNYYPKKSHRYLGVFIGIQFVMWTVGGFYFSWTNINEIRGDHLRAENVERDFGDGLASPSAAISELKAADSGASVHRVNLNSVLGNPVYEIGYESPDGGTKTVLADARTGKLREPITEEQAHEIAKRGLAKPSEVISTELLKEGQVGGHHEYREKPLPAYAITYAEPANLVVYVGQDTGRVESVRTTAWRVFDFFWLFHTLDFYGRDDINNYVLRAFSVLGLVTLASGYVLFFITSPWFRRSGRRNNGDR